MKRCAQCGGCFGLVRYRRQMLQFCSRTCKKLYEHGLKAKVQRHKQEWPAAFAPDKCARPSGDFAA